MAIRESALLFLACCVSTSLAESPFNGPLVGVVVVVALLLSAIVATAAALFIIWIRWQRNEGESTSERVDLESHPRTRDVDTDNKYEEEEEEEESQLRKPVQQPSQEAPVYSAIMKPPVRRADSFTSGDEEITYHNIGVGVGAAVETNHYDDTLQLKPARRAPPTPGKPHEPSKDKEQDSYEKPAHENPAKPARRVPPPRPVIVGEEKHTATSFSPTQGKPGDEEKTQPQLPQVSPVAVKLRPVPQAKPPTQQAKSQSRGSPAPPSKPQLSGPPTPPTKPRSNGPPAPPTKPQSNGPPAPPTKPPSSGPPAPPTKPQSNGPPAPPTKPQSNGPPAPPTKPPSNGPPAPPTKPPSSGPPAPPTKPQSSGPPAPPTKPQSSGPPAPPTKPKSSGPPAPPNKPQSSGPPAPPNKPQSSGPPAPPNKPKFTAPPTPPTKPQAFMAIDTKPKPQVQPKPVGVTSNANNSGTPSSPSKTPKPKVKPRVPAKPLAADGEYEQDSSVPVSVGKFGEHVASLHADGNTGFSREFNSLPMGEFGRAIFDAIMPLHASRNRHANIIPYNDNRPKLEPIPGNKDCHHDYINASFIDGLSTHHRYIAAQGPKKVTIVDFWRLVWQEKVPTIAMVTGLIEDSGRKCERYWPEFGTVVHGPYRVSLSKQQVLADYTLSTLILQPTSLGSCEHPHTVQHMHFAGWLDNESPEQAGPLLSYLRRLNSLHDPAGGPLLVHCSAGVGRTGSLLAIDLALEQARRDGTIDIPAIVSSLRRQRMKMVQTQDQYMFIHDAVLEQLVCGDTQIQASGLNRTLPRLLQPQQKSDGSFKTGLAVQFDVLEQVSPKPDEVSCRKAMLFPNKNRSTDFLPPDERRVELRGSPGYIHASFVQGYRQREAFIIAQAPLEETCRDFWKMVHERECSAIVMLTAPLEEQQYWSEEMDEFERQYGEVSIRTAHRQQMNGYAIHRMILTNRRSGAKREVIQFQLTAWAEDNLWTSPSSLVEAIHHIKAAARKSPNKPIVVHGRDTVSRCGLFCALMAIIDQCATEGVVDVFQVVKALRLTKPGSVPSFAQYHQLFNLTAAYLDSFDTYANFK